MKKDIKDILSNYSEHFPYILRACIAIIVGLILLVTLGSILIFFNNKQNNVEEYNPVYVQTCMMSLKYSSTKLELIDEIDKYIKNIAPLSALDGYVIAEECINNSMDICFVLAQAEQESHFGTTGLARKTNSVFNVYAFDGQGLDEISEKGKYKHPNFSVKPYIELLKNDYLVNGKTEYDLMEEGQYVNKNGARYASSETYEKSLLTKYTKIRQTTKIDSLCQETNKYKMFLGF